VISWFFKFVFNMDHLLVLCRYVLEIRTRLDRVLSDKIERPNEDVQATVRGLYTSLTPPDPSLKGAWYPGGFNPCVCQVKNLVSNLCFQTGQLVQLYATGGPLVQAILQLLNTEPITTAPSS
jgi:hypothetical protein